MRKSYISLLVAAAGILAMGASPQRAPKPLEPPLEKPAVEKPAIEKGAVKKGAIKDAAPEAATEPPVIAYHRLSDAKEMALLSALNGTTSIDVVDMPLKEALELLETKWNLPIIVDQKGLKEAAIDPAGTIVSLHVDKMIRRNSLDLLLGPVKLDWTIDHEVILISSAEELSGRMSVRVYDVTDLTTAEGNPTADFQSLIELITTTVAPQSWDTVGGPGSLKGFQPGDSAVLVVRQNRRTQEHVATLFAELRQAKNHQEKSAQKNAAKNAAKSTDDGKPSSPSAANPASTSPKTALARSNNQFACDLYAKIAAENENVVFSPLSITTALAMTYAGARETAEEFAKVLHLSSPQDATPGEMAALIKSLSVNRSEPAQPQFALANRLWCQKDHAFLAPFLKTCRESYGAEVGLVDMVKQPEAARKTINAWISEQTAEKIPELLAPGAILPAEKPRLVLTNAIYFLGKWEKIFERAATKSGPFYLLDADHKTGVRARFMHAVENYRYALSDGVQMLELPYKGSSLAMTILLPAKGEEAFAKLRQNLSDEKLSQSLATLRPRLVDLQLPAFTMSTNVPLTKVLRDLGLKRAFDETGETVDFSAMDGVTGSDKLVLQDVLHQAVIDVNEEGTEAAAATGVLGFGGGFSPKPLTFRADHPFVYLIRDTRTGCIVFLGQVFDPAAPQ